MRVFVTGGNGFIGSRVVRQLHAAGHGVRLLLRDTSKTHRLEGVPFERHRGDVRDPASLRTGLAGCQGVIHLASLSAWSLIRSPLMREIVLGGTEHLLAAALAEGRPRTVFVSSSTAIAGTETPEILDETAPFNLDPARFVYAAAKHEAEERCRAAAGAGLPVVIVNPCEVYGPDDEDLITAGTLRDALTSWPALAVAGGTAVAHVDDIAAGVVAALERGRPGERYILGGENLTVREILATALAAGGRRTPLLELPTWLVRGLVGTLTALRLPTPILPDVLDYATRYWWMDSRKAERELGYRARPAREAIADAVAWLQASGRVAPAPLAGARHKEQP